MNLPKQLDQFYLAMVIAELKNSNNIRMGNITYNSLLYTDIIALTPNCTVSHIAKLLNVSTSAVTIKVKELEKLGLVIKTRSQSDGRVFYLSVSDEMEAINKKIDSLIYDATQNATKLYSPQEIETFSKVLNTITDYYNNNGGSIQNAD